MIIYCCPKCRITDIGEEGITKNCMRCSMPMISLGISSSGWNSMSSEQMNDAVKDCVDNYKSETVIRKKIAPVEHDTCKTEESERIDQAHILPEEVDVPKRFTGLSVAALICSILGCVSIVGIILGIIDLVQGYKTGDNRKKLLSVAAITVGTVIFVITFSYTIGSSTGRYIEMQRTTGTMTEEVMDTAKEPGIAQETYTGEENLTREEAYKIAETLDGDICAFEYGDFDFDGKSEAFVAIGENTDYNRYPLDAIWFISGSGDVEIIRDDFNHSSHMTLYENNNGYYMESPETGIGFFYGDCGGGGSGWTTFVYGVRDGNPYELDVSMKIEGLYRDNEGSYYTLSDYFDDEGHKYYITELNYDTQSRQFTVGGMTEEEYKL